MSKRGRQRKAGSPQRLALSQASIGITATWQAWLDDALGRGCDVHQLIDIMIRDGGFSRKAVMSAVNGALAARGRLPAAVPDVVEPEQAGPVAFPMVDTTSNIIRAVDRDVSVLLSVDAPRVVVLGNVLSDEECDAMVAYSESRMERSRVVGAKVGENVLDSARTSSGSVMQRGETDIAARLEERLAAIAQWPVERGEGLQVLRYTEGAEYKPHFDWFDPARPAQVKILERGGQRVGTFVIYLSDVEHGGGTNFPKLGLVVAPKKGGAVFFCNVTSDGVPDPLTLHGGMPVVSGVKFVANKWLRERTFV